jgi:undecaprenyl-diphosphatase
MLAERAERFFGRVDAIEHGWCRQLNRSCRKAWVRQFFCFISRLGDGVLWYTLMLLLPLAFGERGLKAAIVMAVTGATGLMLYKFLKARLVRERPFIRFAGIEAGTPPLDRYSFPSGHTLHAVAFTIVAVFYFPMLAWMLVPFAALVAASRVILGLHYPTDVLAGGAIGAILAAGALAVA